MRPFEILIFITVLLSLIGLLFMMRGSPWISYSIGFLLFIVFCHIVFEGGRWQMIPAYVFVFILLLIALKQIFSKRKEQMERPALLTRILKLSGVFLFFYCLS